MKSGGLSCDATNCKHNFNYQCKAGAINISGQSAVENVGTTDVDVQNANLIVERVA